MVGFKTFRSASITIAGIELAHRIRKNQFALGHVHRAHRFNPRTAWDCALFGTA